MSHARALRLPCYMAFLFAGCGASPGSVVGRGLASQPIIGGASDPNDPSIVMMLASDNTGESICTGEVISPHVVLTAAHCVDPASVGTNELFQIFLGSDFNDATQANDKANFVAVKETHYDMAFDLNNLPGGHDVGVVITETPLTVPAMTMNRTALDQTLIGTSLRLVGFGINSGTDTNGTSAGTKRQVMAAVTGVDPSFIELGDAQHETCEGDSGGPALLSTSNGEVIVGIVSFGDKGCMYGGYDTRVDVFVTSFVDPYVQQFDPTPVGSGPAGDGGSGAVGASCKVPSDCQSLLCALDSGPGYCTEACDPTVASSCPAGLTCSKAGNGNFCVLPSHAGGCGVAAGQPSGGSGAALAFGLFGLALVARRRQRRSE